MARVTVEDCVGEGKIQNRFELVVLAAQRTKDIHSGSSITVAVNNDKNSVIALREFADEKIDFDELRARFMNSLHPQSALNTLDEELCDVDKEIVAESFATEGDFGLTEGQMLVDGEMSFEDMDFGEEEKF